MGYQRDPSGRPPTDEEIREIAATIFRAVFRPPPDDPREDICAATHELPPEDEDRVICAMATLWADRRAG